MRARCYYPKAKKFEYYGGRGIAVCDRWKDSFALFLEDMGAKPSPKHSLDRLNKDGNYEPHNCQWSTRAQQDANRSNSRANGSMRKLHPVASKLLADIEAYREKYGLDRTRFGREAAGDGHFIRRLELGKIPRLPTIDRVYKYMDIKTKAVTPNRERQ